MENQPLGSPLVVGVDGNIYGTTSSGGVNGGGVLFDLTTTGVYTVVHRFDESTEGSIPNGVIQGADRKFLWYELGRQQSIRRGGRFLRSTRSRPVSPARCA